MWAMHAILASPQVQPWAAVTVRLSFCTLRDLGERLAGTGYRVEATLFGWFCEWELSVYGESLAKVWKET